MIEKMKFLSITGPKADIDRVVDTYLSKYEIHLEHALSELKSVKDLRPYVETNPYKDIHQRAEQLVSLLPASVAMKDEVVKANALPLEAAITVINDLDKQVELLMAEKSNLVEQVAALETSKDRVIPFSGLNYNLSSIMHFRYVKFRFGRITHEYFDKFARYVYDTIDTVLYKCQEDDDYVWAVYFVPESISDKIDAIYASMHFERFYLPDEYEGTPVEAVHALEEKITALTASIKSIDNQLEEALESHAKDLIVAHEKLSSFSTNFNVRKLAACTKRELNTFYILCGWMSERDAAAFQTEIEKDTDTFCFIEDDHNNISSKPPTKLKNPKLFKPFEMFIQMYGLPDYHEIDPTILIGITYSVLFGFMFGDVGQGICLLTIGFLLYRTKKMNLAAIISCCGFFSTIFGFLFGSVFGFESILEPIWLSPQEAMTKLPFIGNLNTVFIVAIVMGMAIIMMTMILNTINSFHSHDIEKMYFDTNGIAGLVFYGSFVLTAALYMTGHPLPATFLLIVMFLVPLMVIFLKEPLTALVQKKASFMPKEKGMFITQGFFELFEILLSYFSNTLSFVRVGAFAVSHGAMMSVVLMLAGATSGDQINWLVILFGNLFVCGMEGLIVGIQVLRLEYYELFSRFYRGTGRAFKPYGHNVLNK